MNSKQLNIFKTILFIAGLILIAIIYAVVNYPMPEEGLSSVQDFFWAEMVICYLVFAIPLFFGSIALKNLDTKIASTVNIWISVIIFEIVLIAFAVLTLKEIVEIRYAVLIELIVLFALVIFIFFGYFVGNHIGSVQAEEQKSLNKIAEVKSAFSTLNLQTDMWPGELHEQITAIKKLCDDIRYISPVDSDAAAKLEMKLIVAADNLTEMHVPSADLDSKILELRNLVNQRKLLLK